MRSFLGKLLDRITDSEMLFLDLIRYLSVFPALVHFDFDVLKMRMREGLLWEL